MLKLVSNAQSSEFKNAISILDGFANMKVSKFLNYLKKGIQEGSSRAFASESSPSGIRWKKLKKPTGRPMLQRTGKMKAGPAKASSWFLRGTHLTYRDPTLYGIYHITGTEFMPARPWIEYPDAQLIEQSAIKFLNELRGK